MDPRPDPDALLAHVRAEDRSQRARGHLKVFLGATAGVGKTYAMLEEARARRRGGTDVVAGVVETHGRKETEALLEGLEVLPRREIDHRGVQLSELDLDGALGRRPGLLLVDELAHANAPGSRHAKRWQDVEELLGAGIDVYTTVNVQHLESLNDLVAKITHVRVRETVPDAVLEGADEIELIDLPPEELLQRLRDGKVYLPHQAQRATQNFFRKGNLIALRQMAMRKAAERVDAQMQVYRRAHGVGEIWAVAERLLVGVGPAPSSERLVRAAKRMADRMGAAWTAVFVETPDSAHWSEADRTRAWETLRLAERLGAQTVTLSGSDAGAEILAYARAHNVGRIVVGKPTHARWRDRLFGSKVEEVIRGSGDIDVYVITGEEAPREEAPVRPVRREARSPWPAYAWATLLVAAATALVIAVRGVFEIANLAMMLLLAVVIVAARFGRGPAILASVLSVAAFDWFTVPPYNTFRVHDAEYVVTFGVMLVVALTISTLTVRLRDQASASRQREHRTAALYKMSRDLIETVERDEVLRAATRHIRAVFGFDSVVLLPDDVQRVAAWTDELAEREPAALGPQELSVAQWVHDNGRIAGAGTDTLPSAEGLYLPLQGPNGTVGVLGTGPIEPARFRDPAQMHLLETFVNRVAAAVDRWRLVEETRRIRQLEEMDRLKSEFVAQASHELRTPLTTLNLAIDRLRETAPVELPPGWERLLAAAGEDMGRLRKLVDDLLDLARLEAGRMEMERVEVRVPGLVQAAMRSFELQAQEKGIHLACELADGLPPVDADPERIGRVLANLVSNAVRYAAAGGRVLVTADDFGRYVQLSVADDGPGIPLEDQPRIFDRFVRLKNSRQGEGSGLGLAISREIVHAHGGTIWVDSGPGPGSVFSFTLPVAAAAHPAPRPNEKAHA